LKSLEALQLPLGIILDLKIFQHMGEVCENPPDFGQGC
jgi:hypothetical protein